MSSRRLRPQHVGSLADIFGLRWLETEHGVTNEHALNQVAFGDSSTLGIHGFHVDEPKKTLILFVCNPSKCVSDFADSLSRLSERGVDTLFPSPSPQGALDGTLEAIIGPGAITGPTSHFLRQFQTALEESKAVIASVNIRLVFFGEPEAASSAAIIENFREDIVQLRPLIEKRFGRKDIQLTCTVKSADGSTSIVRTLKGYRQTISMANHVRTDGPNGEVLHIGTVSLRELLQMYRALLTQFLARNVRAALKLSTGSNQALAKAFLEVARGDAPPELFLFRHNGVTLTATDCNASDDHLELVEPQILNGAQTVTTLNRVCEELKEKGEYSKTVRVPPRQALRGGQSHHERRPRFHHERHHREQPSEPDHAVAPASAR